jgi:hypothetical protein
MRLQVKALAEDVDPGHQVVIHDVLVSGLQSGRDDDVRVEAFIESKVPPQIASRRLSASGKNQRGAVFRVDLHKVSL